MNEDWNEFDSISPYSDEEAVAALGKLADHPVVSEVSKSLFPKEKEDYLRNVLKNIKSIDEFQTLVMAKAVAWVLDHTAHNFSYDGIANFKKINGRFLALSNHRDIILDPAITQVVLYQNGMQTTEIAVGSNLLSNPYVEALIRSNRMIKVIRGINARSLYLSSQLLSKYIRTCITSGKSSIWIAQREGRTKNGIDTTEQGLLKMLDMSGTKDFTSNFRGIEHCPAQHLVRIRALRYNEGTGTAYLTYAEICQGSERGPYQHNDRYTAAEGQYSSQYRRASYSRRDSGGVLLYQERQVPGYQARCGHQGYRGL